MNWYLWGPRIMLVLAGLSWVYIQYSHMQLMRSIGQLRVDYAKKKVDEARRSPNVSDKTEEA